MHRENYCFTRHGKERLIQAGFDTVCIDLIIEYGCYGRARQGRDVYWIPDSPFLSCVDPRLERVRNYVVVLSEGNVVVSVYARDHRFRQGVLK